MRHLHPLPSLVHGPLDVGYHPMDEGRPFGVGCCCNDADEALEFVAYLTETRNGVLAWCSICECYKTMKWVTHWGPPIALYSRSGAQR